MIGWLCVLFTGLALAQEDEPPTEGGVETVTGKTTPPLSREPRSAALTEPLDVPKTIEEYSAREFPHVAYLGAEMLKLEPEFVNGLQAGLELLYLRKYTASRDHFTALEVRFPGTAARSVADTLVWQALMLENFDYRYDKQYWTSSKQARKDLAAAQAAPGNDAWEHLAMAAIVGIESIHTMRQGSYLSALQLAFQAMDQIEKCRKAAPTFVDLKLADGMYNYWRSVITMNSKILPNFGDHRVEGIEQMGIVEDQGVFMRPMASLALAFTWLEENDMRRASMSCSRIRSKYPDNIVNNLTCGMIYTTDRRYSDAHAVYDRILAVDANNCRVHYWRGLTYLKQNQLDHANGAFTKYLASSHLEPSQRSYGHLRLGQVQARQRQYAAAIASYQAAVKVDGNKTAKASIGRLEERKKEGKITW